MPWSTIAGDLATERLEPAAQTVQGLVVGQVERQMVELGGVLLVGHAGRLGEGLGVGHLEERHRVAGGDLEEVVAHGAGIEGGHEAHAEHAMVEAHGRVHVGRDQGQVVDYPASGVRTARSWLHGTGDQRRRPESGLTWPWAGRSE